MSKPPRVNRSRVKGVPAWKADQQTRWIGVRQVHLTEEKKPGRPPLSASGAMKRYAVMLDSETVERAQKLGEGNLSAGLRIALFRVRLADERGFDIHAIRRNQNGM